MATKTYVPRKPKGARYERERLSIEEMSIPDVIDYMKHHPKSNGAAAPIITRTWPYIQIDALISHAALHGLSHEPLIRKLIEANI